MAALVVVFIVGFTIEICSFGIDSHLGPLVTYLNCSLGRVTTGDDSQGAYGKALSIAKLIHKNPALMEMNSFDVFEFHEAFAHLIVGAQAMLDSPAFCKEHMQLNEKVGRVPDEKLNRWGGSLALGHPFSATGIRIMATAANRLIHEDGSKALIASCAQGGQGVAAVLERHPMATEFK